MRFSTTLIFLPLVNPALAEKPDLFSGVYEEVPFKGYKETLYYVMGPGEFIFTRSPKGVWELSTKESVPVAPLFQEWAEVTAELVSNSIYTDPPKTNVICITPRKAENYGLLFCYIA